MLETHQQSAIIPTMDHGLPQLIQLAIQACSSEGEIDEDIDRVEKYLNAFADWMEDHGETLEHHPDEFDAELLKDLNNRHQAVIRHATELKGQTKKDLVAQHSRGRGIMAYTDILPKRIRVTKARKG